MALKLVRTMAGFVAGLSLLGGCGFLAWLSHRSGVAWAYSHWDTKQFFDFGGNPSEVYSHLVNWALMLSWMGGLCLNWVLAVNRSSQNSEVNQTREFLSAPYIVFVLLTGFWACIADGHSGEGATIGAIFILFGPAMVCLSIWAGRIVDSGVNHHLQYLLVIGLAVSSVLFQWLYQPSDSGGPNILALPLLGIQLAVVRYFARRVRHRPFA